MRLLTITAVLWAGLVQARRPAPDAGVAGLASVPAWLGEELPLPLAVKSADDLAFKASAERQYLEFNLLAAGKYAWDHGDFELAANRWEALLALPRLPPELETLVRPLAHMARERGGRGPASSAPLISPALPEPDPAAVAEVRRPPLAQVSGVITGGGSHGPGGSVIVLRRVDGPTPRPRVTRVTAVLQKNKRFVPHVLAVPVGATVEFRNEDDLFHNVFSLSKPNDFDLGLYKSGVAREQVFNTPGPVHLLCNIHASMGGWVYVVDSAYFAQADASGRFTVKNVPVGTWRAEVWHEWSTKTVTRDLEVTAGMAKASFAVEGDRQAPAFVPDKSGKPRQPQLGY